MRHQQLILVQPKQCDHGSDDTLLHSQIAFIALRKCLTVYCSGPVFLSTSVTKQGFVCRDLWREISVDVPASLHGWQDNMTPSSSINFWSQTSTLFFKNISISVPTFRSRYVSLKNSFLRLLSGKKGIVTPCFCWIPVLEIVAMACCCSYTS